MILKKPRILVWCDTPTVPTGFGVVAKNLFKYFYKKYDLSILGINYHGDTRYDTTKWFIYPAMQYPDELGIRKMDKIIPQINPEVIILFQDIFHIENAWEKVNKLSPKSKKIIYFPVDGSPFNISWEKPLMEADVVITYTEFAKNEILKTFPELSKRKIFILDHGVDPKAYYPLPKEEIIKIRKEHNWDKRFVLLNLNRFQPRKMVPLSLRAAALFTKGYKKCKCGNWYLKDLDACDLNGCGKEDVIETVEGRPETLLYLHMVPNEPGMGPGHANSLQAHAYNAGYRDIDLTGPDKILHINRVDLYRTPYSEEALNQIYNASCVNISTTVGEGFGFSLAESQSTGTINIAPYNSAIPEVLGDTGHLIPNLLHFNMPNDNGHMRPIVDIRKMIEAFEIEYQRWIENDKDPIVSEEIVKHAREAFNWDDKREFIEDIVDNLLNGKNIDSVGSTFVFNKQ